MDYVRKYPDIKQKKKHKSKKVSYALDSLGLSQKFAQIFTSYQIFEIWSRNIFFISKSFFFIVFYFYHLYFDTIIVPYGNSEIW